MPLNSNKKSSREAKILPQFSIYSGNKPLLDLLEIQRKSFFDLLERGIIQELSKTDTFRETTKNSGFTQKLELVFNPETYKLVSPNCTPKQAILKGKTYAGKLYVQATLTIRSLPRESAVETDTNKTPKNLRSEKVFDLLSRKTKQKNSIDYVKKESSNAVADFASLSLPLLFPEGCLSPPNGLGKYTVNDDSFVNISSSLVNQKYSGVSQVQNSGNEKNVTKHQRIFTKSSDFLTPFVNNFPLENVVSRENKKHILKLNMRVNVDFVKSAILLSRFPNSASQNLSTSFENIPFFTMINGIDQIKGGNKFSTSFITPLELKADTFGVLRSTFASLAATPSKGGHDNEKNSFLTDSKEHKNLSISQETLGLKEQRKAHRNLTKISPLLRNLGQPVSSLSFVNCCELNKLQARRVFDLKDPFGVFSLTWSTPLVNYSNDEEKLDFLKKVPMVHFPTAFEKGSNRSFLIGLLKTRLFESPPGKESKTESKITRSTATFLGTPNKIKEKIQQQKTHWLRQWKDSIKPASFTMLCVGSKASFLIAKGVNNNNALLAGAKQGDKTANKERWLLVAKQSPFAAKPSIVKNEHHKNAKNLLYKDRKVIPYNSYGTNVSPFWNETVDTSNYWQSLCSFPGIYSKGVRGNPSLLLSPSVVPLSGALDGKEVLLRTHNAVTPFGGYKKFCLFTPHYMQKEYKGQLLTPQTPSGGKGSMQTSKIQYKSEIPFSFVNSYTSFARPTFVETPAIWNDLFYQKSRRYPVNVKFSLTPLSKLHLRGILKSQTKGSVNTSPTYWNQRKLFSFLSLTTPINCQVHSMLLKSSFVPKEITSTNFANHTKKQTIKSGFDPLGEFNSISPLGAASNPCGKIYCEALNAGGLKVEDFNQLPNFVGDQISVTPGSVSQSSKQKDFTSKNTLALRFLQGEQTPLKGRKILKNVSYGTPYPSGASAAEQREQKKKDGDVKIFRPWIFLGELPLMTKRGHFILNGSPRVIVNQIARCPGIYFQEKRRGVGFEQEVRVSADLIPQRGPWLRIQSDWEGRFWARLKREGRVKYATLYEAFQEFEKEYSAPLVSLVTNSSSIFPKSEVFAFHERKAKEDRQKKALVRLFKNSTRYSLGKQGRSRINQRVHSQKVVSPSFMLQKLEKGYPGGRGKNHAVSSLFEDSTNLIYTKNVRQFLTNKKPNFTSYAQLLGVAPTFLYQLPAFRDLLTTSISPAVKCNFSKISTKPYPLTSKASKRGSGLAKLLLSTKLTIASAFDQKFENNGKLHQLTDTTFLSKDYKDQTPWPLPFDWEIKNDVENVLMAADINAVHTYLEHLLEGQGFTDDIDHLKNRLVRTSGKLLQQQLELGLNRLNEVITPLLGNLIQSQLFSSLSSSLPGEGGQSTPISITVKDPLLTSNKKSVSSFVDPGGVSSNKGDPMTHAESIGGVANHAGDLVTEADNFPTLSSTPYPPNPPEGGKGGMNKEGGRVKGFLQKAQGQILPLTRKKQGKLLSPVVSNSKVGEREQASLKKKPLAAKQQMAASLPLMWNSKNSKKGKNKVTPGLRPYPSGLSSLESETPFRWLRTSKPVNNAFREFFGSNPLSQYMDQTNPLAEITHKRRLSSMGPGGIKRETAGMEVRGIHPTHYGRVCPIETPEGKNAGLVNSPTVYGRIGNNGFMETPLYQVLESQIQKERWTFFSAQQEEDEESSLATGDTGNTRFNLLSGEANVPIPVQTANNPLAHFQQVERNRVGYKALSPVQTISIATALIPFLEHDDANRALMGSNMQRQAIPLLSPERPIVGTGFEPMVTAESGQAVQATKIGCVSHVSANKIILQTIHSINPEGAASNKIPHQTTTKLRLCSTQNSFIFKKVEQPLQIYQRSNQETCLSQRPLVQEGDWVQKGDFLADCSASNSGDLALGKNVTVAYMPWEGYNFEDAIVISDRLVANDIYTSIHIERYEIKVSKNSQGKERITSQIPSLPSRRLKHLDNSGIARVSSWVQPGDILVGKVVELKRPLSPYERLAWELASRLSPTSPEREKWLSKVWLEDISLRLPPGVCGRVINFQVISTEWSDKEQLAHPLEVHVYLAVKRKIQVGDKLAGRHGNKGIVSIVLPRQDMPYLGDGSTVDMVLNPLGVPSRMNLGQIFECLLGLAGSQLGCNFKVTPFDEIAGGEASRSLVFLKLYQCRLMYKQQWLFTPTFPGKNKLFDGRTGEPFENWVTVGKAYMLKLIHMVDHKIHARSTGPYSLFTRQPVRGRSRRGGQRLGEMEVWAVEGFGAAYTLQEFLTIKSDDLKARAALQRSFYKQNDVTLGKVHISPGNPEAFKVLVSELQALCLHIQM